VGLREITGPSVVLCAARDISIWFVMLASRLSSEIHIVCIGLLLEGNGCIKMLGVNGSYAGLFKVNMVGEKTLNQN